MARNLLEFHIKLAKLVLQSSAEKQAIEKTCFKILPKIPNMVEYGQPCTTKVYYSHSKYTFLKNFCVRKTTSTTLYSRELKGKVCNFVLLIFSFRSISIARAERSYSCSAHKSSLEMCIQSEPTSQLVRFFGKSKPKVQ